MCAALVLASTAVMAQDSGSSLLADVAKRVVLDPTTYTPALVSHYATTRDWQTSQPFFAHGANEMNPGFTISGRPNDMPVSYDEGGRRILRDSLVKLQISAASNATGEVIERLLVTRYPTHRKAIRTVGWVQRVALSSYLTYQWSVMHFRQTNINEQLAQQYGY
jgi:hypothetical protein